MAVDLQVNALFEEVFADFYCIGRHRVIQYEADFGVSFGAFVGKLINVQFFMWSDSVGAINQPVPVTYGELPEGYNIIVPNASTGWIELDMSYPGKETWKNYKVEADIDPSGLMNLRITFMHTMDMKSWIADKGSRDNNKRFWNSKWNDTAEFTVANGSFYQVAIGNNQYLGLKVSLYDIVNEQYILNDSATLAEQRNYAYFWNPTVQVDPTVDPPYVYTKNYAWELTRNSIPVSTLSTTADTHVKFRIESHPLDPDMAYDTLYNVGLVRIDPPGNNDEKFMPDLPAGYGYAWGSGFGQEEMFPHQINGHDIVEAPTNFTNTTGDFYELEFDIPKEVIDAGCKYRIYVVIRYVYNILL